MSAQGLARVWWLRVSPAEAAVAVAVPGALLFGRASAQLTATVEPGASLREPMISWTWLLFCATFSGRNFQVAGILSDAERPHHGPFRFLRRPGQNPRKRNKSFAKRNETFRSAGLNSLKSLRSANHRFRGIVYFQWFNCVFVSRYFT
jgi:hypothetical protein